MTRPRIYVNRDHEITETIGLVSDKDASRRVAAIHGSQGIGKSELLRELRRRLREQTAVAIAHLADHTDARGLLGTLATQLDEQRVDMTAFFELEATLTGTQPLNLQLSKIKAKQSRIDVSIESTEHIEYHSNLLVRQFYASIEGSPGPPRCLLLIDGYDDAGGPLAGWIQNSLVERAATKERSVCVVSGRDILKPQILDNEDICLLPLPPLEVRHVDIWLREAGLKVDNEYAAFLWNGTGGVPGVIKPFIDNLVKNQ